MISFMLKTVFQSLDIFYMMKNYLKMSYYTVNIQIIIQMFKVSETARVYLFDQKKEI